ncbi:hypothetical protein PF005_g3222 [Phytophthora fragariae]|uniref:DDE-1 domain-containing protein n=1 Tax=Phytophthora fragariae TaxID=53985 RepID=A0A6A4A6B7_9STRA|nr:hypothetical protein PF003_g17554 [Phytophthora fragariae]KAE8947788.1 hypothetical protein PF009_g2629 [Phytophthora fragariae]KAE9028773.1 hypothetical protein PF011_g1416 [Phytophthora fragariae]KAE9133603.1 hypothetical protein PF010_g2768 [Phytophthora fragariae]KAE9133959.1 hypothetical protein PF007_g3123 [Phytophthora fragariae]
MCRKKGMRLTSATVCALPANSTAVCQPLDVGVMGPPTRTGAYRLSQRQSSCQSKALDFD